MDDVQFKRPLVIWFIVIYLVLAFAGGLVGNTLAFVGIIPGVARTYLEWSFVAAGLVLMIAYAILLFRLSKIALVVIGIWLFAGLLGLGRQALIANAGVEVLTAQSIFNIGFLSGLTLYTIYLFRKRIIR